MFGKDIIIRIGESRDLLVALISMLSCPVLHDLRNRRIEETTNGNDKQKRQTKMTIEFFLSSYFGRFR